MLVSHLFAFCLMAVGNQRLATNACQSLLPRYWNIKLNTSLKHQRRRHRSWGRTSDASSAFTCSRTLVEVTTSQGTTYSAGAEKFHTLIQQLRQFQQLSCSFWYVDVEQTTDLLITRRKLTIPLWSYKMDGLILYTDNSSSVLFFSLYDYFQSECAFSVSHIQ